MLLLLFGLAGCTQKPEQQFQLALTSYHQGRIGGATRMAEAGYRSFPGRSSEWHWKYGVLLAELQLLHGKTKEAEALLGDTPPGSFPSLLPRYEMLRGYLLARQKKYQEALTLSQQAITDAHNLKDAELEADACLWLGTSRFIPEQFETHRVAFEKARELAEANHLPYQQAAALMNLGMIQIKRERYADAIPLLERAGDAAGQAGAAHLSALALNDLAVCYEGLGDIARALEAQRKSVAQLEKFGLETSLSNGYSELGAILLKNGQQNEAIQYFRKALASVSKDAPAQYTLAAGNMASALAQTGAVDEAERFNKLALESADAKRADQTGILTANQALIAERRGKIAEAIADYRKLLAEAESQPSSLWQAYAGMGALYGKQGDFAQADESYTKALTVIETNRADQLKSNLKITFLSNLLHFYQDYVALLMKHGNSERALEIADSSRASVLTEALRGNSEPRRRSLAAHLEQLAKRSGSVFLFYWLTPQQSYLWAISGTGTKVFPLPDQKKIEQDVLSYRALIEEQKRDPLESLSPTGMQLFEELVKPAAESIAMGQTVVIVPDGVLHNLNFETLLVATPAPHYWIEDATLAVAPSLGLLEAKPRAARPVHSALLIGHPVSEGTGFADLPQAAEEIASIERVFAPAPSKAITGAQANAAAYFDAQPEQYSAIHFAAHVDANARSPLDSSIILSPSAQGYRLYARDVAEKPLQASLVTISACRGAGARTLSGEGLVGFAWAFFQARAQNVVTSLWDVSDRSTPALMRTFYTGVSANRSYTSALRQAKLEMIHHSDYRRPYYWAPFQLYTRTVAAR